jgi:hypothetical protein
VFIIASKKSHILLDYFFLQMCALLVRCRMRHMNRRGELLAAFNIILTSSKARRWRNLLFFTFCAFQLSTIAVELEQRRFEKCRIGCHCNGVITHIDVQLIEKVRSCESLRKKIIFYRKMNVFLSNEIGGKSATLNRLLCIN